MNVLNGLPVAGIAGFVASTSLGQNPVITSVQGNEEKGAS